eukprot:Gb_18971 [translate_table: standard]
MGDEDEKGQAESGSVLEGSSSSQHHVLQFAPWQSSVDEGFWRQLAKLKLDILGISQKPIEITGMNQIILAITLGFSSFTMSPVPENRPVALTVAGIVTIRPTTMTVVKLLNMPRIGKALCIAIALLINNTSPAASLTSSSCLYSHIACLSLKSHFCHPFLFLSFATTWRYRSQRLFFIIPTCTTLFRCFRALAVGFMLDVWVNPSANLKTGSSTVQKRDSSLWLKRHQPKQRSALAVTGPKSVPAFCEPICRAQISFGGRYGSTDWFHASGVVPHGRSDLLGFDCDRNSKTTYKRFLIVVSLLDSFLPSRASLVTQFVGLKTSLRIVQSSGFVPAATLRFPLQHGVLSWCMFQHMIARFLLYLPCGISSCGSCFAPIWGSIVCKFLEFNHMKLFLPPLLSLASTSGFVFVSLRGLLLGNKYGRYGDGGEKYADLKLASAKVQLIEFDMDLFGDGTCKVAIDKLKKCAVILYFLCRMPVYREIYHWYPENWETIGWKVESSWGLGKGYICVVLNFEEAVHGILQNGGDNVQMQNSMPTPHMRTNSPTRGKEKVSNDSSMEANKVKILAWNVQGALGLGRRALLRSIVAKLRPNVLLLQEVKVIGFHLNMLLSSCSNGDFMVTSHDEGRGGVVCAVASWLSPYILAKVMGLDVTVAPTSRMGPRQAWNDCKWVLGIKDVACGQTTLDVGVTTTMVIRICPNMNTNLPFKLNVSLLQSEECLQAIERIWNLVPCPQSEEGWILSWEASVLRTTKFLRGW